MLASTLLPLCFLWIHPDAPDLRTVAERSGFRATARYDELIDLCRALDARSDSVRLTELGATTEGRSIPLLFVAEPMVHSLEEARVSGKVVCLLLGSIHGGEVCGKEALPMLVRELTDRPGHPLLQDVILAVAPLYNADGAERFAVDNRPGQDGPVEGMGERENAQGLDLNRDFVKAEAPETRGLLRFLNEWDPHVFIDTHTTNGSAHRYLITYDGAKNPAGDSAVLDYTHDRLLPAIDGAFEARSGRDAFYYGNFEADHSVWGSYPAEPRYGTNYVGLRNRVSILCEAYSYAPCRDRVLGTLDFVRAALETVARDRDHIRSLCAAADRRAASAEPGELATIATKLAEPGEEVTILGVEESSGDEHPRFDAPPRDYTAKLRRASEPAVQVARAVAYLVPADQAIVRDRLERHGIRFEPVGIGERRLVERYTIRHHEQAGRPYQGHRLRRFEVDGQVEALELPPGSVLVPTAQPLGALASYLLEPESEDGLATWEQVNLGDREAGDDFPIYRIVEGDPDAAAEDEKEKPLLTLDKLPGGGRGGPGGGFGPGQRWFDAHRFIEEKDGEPKAVDALTGEVADIADEPKLEAAIAQLPNLDEQAAEGIARRATSNLDPAKESTLFRHGDDLYYARLDGSEARQLTGTPGEEELAEFSPDGRFVAFIRANDLHVVDVETGTERALTTGGSDLVRNGKNVWVYFEELFGRSWKAFWWSPDSKHIAFLRLDDRPLESHVVLDDTAADRIVEETPYPFSGDPNPLAEVGIVSVAGGAPAFADLADYTKGDFLVSHLGWLPDGSAALAYVQNRTQTWLDVLKVPTGGGAPTKLFRETTGAWVESPGDPTFLPDGTFLWLSERDGWKHLYHYDQEGELLARITEGEWEIQRVVHLDAEAGKVAFTATKDSPIAPNLYAVDLGDRCIERLTAEPGSHSISLSPDGQLYIDTYSSVNEPPTSVLRRLDGEEVRVLSESEPGLIEDFAVGPRGLVKIKARDGYELEAELILPANLDETKKYPVWFQTYAGPHSPVIRDDWAGGDLRDRALANEGFILFSMDPRSASGKGAASAWAAYKQLGVKELEDITDAIEWLKRKPYVDGDRIGMTGHSYGGFMTAYAMTHSKLFSCGIAGAPVTDWRNYDSIYTERFMLTPQENPEGYAKSSVVEAAKDLHGNLLIVHGVKDDNVSFRNTLQLVHALQQADKDFELMIYPDSRHGIGSPHYRRLQLEFIRRNLGGGPMPAAGQPDPQPAERQE